MQTFVFMRGRTAATISESETNATVIEFLPSSPVVAHGFGFTHPRAETVLFETFAVLKGEAVAFVPIKHFNQSSKLIPIAITPQMKTSLFRLMQMSYCPQ